ncbi:MAG: hypothetical protein DRI95_03960, partial [Bacteroidetes bacterium]
MNIFNSFFWPAILVFILNIHSEQALAQLFNDCQNAELSGKYVLTRDSDGKTPKNGAIITLTLSGNSASINAKMPNNEVISGGNFYACNNIISISFSDFDFGADKQPFSISGNTLSLPFKVLGGNGEGNSVWSKIQSNNLFSNTTLDPFSGVSSDIDPLNNQNQNSNNENNSNVPESSDNDEYGQDENRNKNNDQPENFPNNSRSTNSQYVGDYIGTGWGWE